MQRKFPQTREDGTFCVVVKFETTQNAAILRDHIAEWCNQWIEEHKHWQCPVGDSFIDKGPWDYFEIFTGPPSVIKAEDNQLWLRFDTRVYSYWWRDWFASMMGDLTHAFSGLKSPNRLIFNCDDESM